MLWVQTSALLQVGALPVAVLCCLALPLCSDALKVLSCCA